MNIETLEQMIVKRGNNVVQDKIRKLRADLATAIGTFVGSPPYDKGNRFMRRDDSRHWAVLLQLASEDPCNGWPKWLWEEERQRVRAEILGTMDAMQKMLVARDPSPDDCTPAETDEKA